MLTDYKNDLFATHVDIGSALVYVNTLYSGTSTPHDSLVMRTAVHIVINTAIEMHRAEKQVLVDKINEMSARANPVTALLTLVREQVQEALEAQNASIEEGIENYLSDNLSDKIDEWYGNNVDVGDAIERYVENHLGLEETISEQISNYFGNNTFSIEPR